MGGRSGRRESDEGLFEGLEVGGEALFGVEAGGLGVAGPDVEGEAGAAGGAGEVLDGGEEAGGVAGAAEGGVEAEVVEVEFAAGDEVGAGGRLFDAAEGVADDEAAGGGGDEDGGGVVGEDAFEFGGGVFGAAGDEEIGAALGVDVVDLVEEVEEAGDVGGGGAADGGGGGRLGGLGIHGFFVFAGVIAKAGRGRGDFWGWGAYEKGTMVHFWLEGEVRVG